MTNYYICDTARIALPEYALATRKDGKTFEFHADDVGKFIKDAEIGRNASLSAYINATHSGTIVNRRVYPGQKMKAGLGTWVNKYPKPVLDRHPHHSIFGGGEEPKILGRVRSASYVRLANSDIDLANDWKNPTEGGTGSGFTRLLANISDKDAMEGILDKRLFTVSTGQYTDQLTCSICGADQARHGCEHTAGRFYRPDHEQDNERSPEFLCYQITGNLSYDHVAFVNTPASPYAAVIAVDSQGNAIEEIEVDSPQLLDFSIHKLILTDEFGDIEFNLSDIEGGRVKSDRRISAVITSINGDTPTAMSSMPTENRPGLAAGVVLQTVQAADNETPAKETQMDPKNVAEALILKSILDADMEFDWEGYEEKTGRDRSFVELASADNDSNLPETLVQALDGKIDDDAYFGPGKSFPVVDELTVEAAQKHLPFVLGDGKSLIDAKIQEFLNPSEKIEDSQPNTELRDELNVLKDENEQLKSQISDLQDQLKVARSQVKNTLVDKIIDLRQKLDKPSVRNAKDTELESIRKGLKARRMDSLEDTLRDLQEEMEEVADDLKRESDKEAIEDPGVRVDSESEKETEKKDVRILDEEEIQGLDELTIKMLGL